MNICKKCGVEIEDGNELCEKCKLGDSQLKENYLDDLLQSVDMNPVQTRLEGLAKKSKVNKEKKESLEDVNLLNNGKNKDEELPTSSNKDDLYITDDVDMITENVDKTTDDVDKTKEEEAEDLDEAFMGLHEDVNGVMEDGDIKAPDEAEMVLADGVNDTKEEVVETLEETDMSMGEDGKDTMDEEEVVEPLDEAGLNLEEGDSSGVNEEVFQMLDDLQMQEDAAGTSTEEAMNEDFDPPSVDKGDKEDLGELAEIDDLLKKFEEEGLMSDETDTSENTNGEGDNNADDSGMDELNSSMDILEQLMSQEESPIDNEPIQTDGMGMDGMLTGYGGEEGVEGYEGIEGFGDNLEDPLMAASTDADGGKSKPSLFKRLFSNVVDEKEMDKVAEEKRKELEKEILKQEKKDKGKEDAEEKKKQQEIIKEEKKKQKQEKKQQKLEEKQEKKRLKQEQKELEALNDESEVEGRINKAGAAIVFSFIAAIVVLVITGTGSFSYNQAVELGNEYFAEGEYSKAYEALNGTKLREKDERLYKQLRVIMYVWKEKQAYDDYWNMGMYLESVHALLKGLDRYQENISYASELGVADILDEVKQTIISDLNVQFHLTEETAMEIISIEDETEYTIRVLQVLEANGLPITKGKDQE